MFARYFLVGALVAAGFGWLVKDVAITMAILAVALITIKAKPALWLPWLMAVCGFGYFDLITYGTAGQSGEFAAFYNEHKPNKSEVSGQKPTKPTYELKKVSLSGDRAIVGVTFHDFARGTSSLPRFFLVSVKDCHGHGHLASGSFRVRVSGVLQCTNQKEFLLASLRSKILSQVKRLFNAPTSVSGSWAYATLFGERKLVDPSVMSVLRHYGLVHMTSVSGFHLSLVVVFIRLLFALTSVAHRALSGVIWGRKKTRKKAVAIVAIIGRLKALSWLKAFRWLKALCRLKALELSVIVMWLFLVSFRPSAVRAFMCYLAVMVLAKSQRNRQLSETITLALTGFLLVAPLDFLSFSSMLSWLSYGYLAIIYHLFLVRRPSGIAASEASLKESGREGSGSRMLSKWQTFTKHTGQRVVYGAGTLLVCQLGLQWLSFLMVGELSWLGVFGNLVILPLLLIGLKAIMIGAILVVISSVTPWQAMEDLFGVLLTAIDGLFHLLMTSREHLYTWFPLMSFRHQIPTTTGIFLELVTMVLLFFLFIKTHHDPGTTTELGSEST